MPSEARCSESDSGASSADPEEDQRTSSSMGCFRPQLSPASDHSTLSKLPSPASDSERYLRKLPIDLEGFTRRSLLHSPVSTPPVSDQEHFMRRSPLHSPVSACVASDNSRKEVAALPPMDGVVLKKSDPAQLLAQIHGGAVPWRDFWMRTPMTVADCAPEQDEPIDLSVRAMCSKSDGPSNIDSRLSLEVRENSNSSKPLDLAMQNKINVTAS